MGLPLNSRFIRSRWGMPSNNKSPTGLRRVTVPPGASATSNSSPWLWAKISQAWEGQVSQSPLAQESVVAASDNCNILNLVRLSSVVKYTLATPLSCQQAGLAPITIRLLAKLSPRF